MHKPACAAGWAPRMGLILPSLFLWALLGEQAVCLWHTVAPSTSLPLTSLFWHFWCWASFKVAGLFVCRRSRNDRVCVLLTCFKNWHSCLALV